MARAPGKRLDGDGDGDGEWQQIGAGTIQVGTRDTGSDGGVVRE